MKFSYIETSAKLRSLVQLFVSLELKYSKYFKYSCGLNFRAPTEKRFDLKLLVLQRSHILLFSTLMMFAVSGCAYQEVLNRQMMEFESTIPTCDSKEECEIKWAAAQQWITGVYAWDFLRVADDFMEAYDPRSRYGITDVRVVKWPMGNNKYRIVIYIYGDPHPIKKYPIWDELGKKIDFNRFVNSAY